jgi:hypothetical protein
MHAFCNRFALLCSVLPLLAAQAQDLPAALSQPSDPIFMAISYYGPGGTTRWLDASALRARLIGN